jgi:hypothetical protein
MRVIYLVRLAAAIFSLSSEVVSALGEPVTPHNLIGVFTDTFLVGYPSDSSSQNSAKRI